MCGIAGLWQREGGNPDVAAIAQRMGRALRHRGPDDEGVWADVECGVGLAHRRLSVIDLSPAGQQPMLSADGRYQLVYNGEVYNFAELRRELQSKGHGFRGHSDSEVILAAIVEFGLERAVERFVGMFAFALWDRRDRRLSLVRDRLGIKPLYWGFVGNCFAFASELSAFRAVPGWRGDVDRDALATYLRFGQVPAPFCIFDGLAKLHPGQILTLTSAGGPEIVPFWSLREVAKAGQAPVRLSDGEAADRLQSLLDTAVQQRMLADVPLGALLSGGIDSSLVVAAMQAASSRPVKTFTIGFHDPRFNEAEHARAIAAHLGTEHHETYVTADDALAVVPDLPAIYDEPFADSSQIPTYLVSRMTRQHVTVALSGDGGDELMAGYTRYRWAELMHGRCATWPLPLRRGLAAGLDRTPASMWKMVEHLLPDRLSSGRMTDKVGRLADLLRQPDADAIYHAQHRHWPDPDAVVDGGRARPTLVDDASLRDSFPHFVTRMQVMDSLGYLPDDVLTKVDRASMAVALEVRVPLLDHRIQEFAWSLPFHQKFRDGTSKWLLRQLLYRYLPVDLVERPKMGFAVPLAAWLRGPLRDWAEAMLDRQSLEAGGVFRAEPVKRLWSAFLQGHDRFREPIWTLLMYQAWQQSLSASTDEQPDSSPVLAEGAR